MLHILLVTKMYSKLMNVCAYMFFWRAGCWTFACIPVEPAPEHLGAVVDQGKDFYSKCAWKLSVGSEQRNDVASYWVYKIHSGCHIGNQLKELRGDTGRPVWRLLQWPKWDRTGLRLGWLQRRWWEVVVFKIHFESVSTWFPNGLGMGFERKGGIKLFL